MCKLFHNKHKYSNNLGIINGIIYFSNYKIITNKYTIKKYFFIYPLSFLFCDPPYLETSGYDNKFGEEEHIILLDKLKNLKGKFLLTINDHEKVRDWYEGFNIKEVEVNYSVSKKAEGRGKYKELIITNY